MKNYLILILILFCHNTFAQNHGVWFGTKVAFSTGMNIKVLEVFRANGGVKDLNELSPYIDVEFNGGQVFGFGLRYQYQNYYLSYPDLFRKRTMPIDKVGMSYNVIAMDFRFYQRSDLNANGFFIHFGPVWHILHVKKEFRNDALIRGYIYENHARIGSMVNLSISFGMGAKIHINPNQFLNINGFTQFPLSYIIRDYLGSFTERSRVKEELRNKSGIGGLLNFSVGYGINIK